ncbi:tetraspanin-19 [Rhododendron vialii]|uniref:tetraspanin-19 n=1 Tax=Rhododendron vialii TaxID=182163 RepID=UPI00265E1953|nr:tetraspanin-19 [Rhododendron vialii]
MGRMLRSCMQSLLKLVNSVVGMTGIAMILYGLWMIRDWQRHMDDGPSPFVGPDTPAPWFMYTFLALGVTLCVITCSGHIAAETSNGWCLYCYMVFVFLLLVLEAAVTADVFLNHKWQEDFPADPTGNFDEFKDFVKKNFKICKWIGLSVVCVQCLCMLLATILRNLGPHSERCYDSDDDYIPDRVPLLKNYVHPHYAVGDPIYGSKNDSWNVRINDKTNR